MISGLSLPATLKACDQCQGCYGDQRNCKGKRVSSGSRQHFHQGLLRYANYICPAKWLEQGGFTVIEYKIPLPLPNSGACPNAVHVKGITFLQSWLNEQ